MHHQWLAGHWPASAHGVSPNRSFNYSGPAVAYGATPHQRDATAAGVDSTVIALRLGHETTRTNDIYLHADLTVKQRAIDRTAPTGTRPGRYRPPDRLLTVLKDL